MKISHRLYITVAPSVIGVLAVAGLAYWGQYAHTVPQLLVAIAAVAAIGSMVLSWRNARYVAQRIERLAGSSTEDELDTIEGVVNHLSSAVAEAGATLSERDAAAQRQVADYATMLASTASESAGRLEEVRLPLHILLENHFGDLNENQEEMLGAARNAAEAVDADLVAMQEIAELDLGTRDLRRDRLLPADLVRSLLPTLQAIADQQHATLAVDIEPLVPAMRGDQPRLQDALATIIGGAIRGATAGASMTLTVARDGADVRIDLRDGGVPSRNLKLVLAGRIVVAHGGAMSHEADQLTVRFPTLR